MRAALYARVSTEEQAERGVSVDAQLDRLRSYAKYREWSVWDEFKEKGWSGKNDDRPELRRLMAAVRGKYVDVVVVTKLDRFMRNTRLLFQYIDDFKKLGVGFIAADDNIDTTQGNTGELMLTLLAAVAQWERERISERIKDARRYSAEQGRWLMGRTLYGYRWNKDAKRFEVVEEEAKVVKRIYDWYVTHNLGFLTIAVKLNEEGCRRPRGNHWDVASVRYLSATPPMQTRQSHTTILPSLMRQPGRPHKENDWRGRR